MDPQIGIRMDARKIIILKTKKEGRGLKLQIGKLQIKYRTISAVHYLQFPALSPHASFFR